jgi:hypothetical protein
MTVVRFCRLKSLWARIMDALAAGQDAAVQMTDTSVCVCTSTEPASRTTITKIWVRGLVSKVHAVADTNSPPVHLALTRGEAQKIGYVCGFPQRLASTNDVTRGPWIRHGLVRQLVRQQGAWAKLAASYLAFIKLASIRIWLRANESAP